MPEEKYILAKDWRFWAVMVLITLIMCAVYFGFLIKTMMDQANKPFVDPNGPDDPSLTSITLDEIVSTTGDFTAVMSSNSYSGSGTGVTGKLGDYDHDRCRHQFRRIDGIMTLHATRARSSDLTLEIETELISGNLEVVILVDGEYHSHVDINGWQKITLENVKDKTVVVRMAAEGAQMEITIERE